MTADIFANIAQYIDQYGYWAVFFGVLLEDLGIPMPGETMLIAGATVAGSTGEMSIVLLILTTPILLLPTSPSGTSPPSSKLPRPC